MEIQDYQAEINAQTPIRLAGDSVGRYLNV
jgi:hypothetical protein